MALRLGNYEPLLELASGGMATVFVARLLGAAGFERLVVIKRVHRHLLSNREFYDMFRDEARVASLIRHPNVVPVIDVVESDRELFLVMEYVESCSLATLRRNANVGKVEVPPGVIARVMYDTLAGLQAAHEAVDMRGQPLEVVHRDVSPQNVIVGVDGSSRLIDFGVAKAAHRLTETRSGSLKGKYSYMAPEQARGEAVDRRTDVFSAGVVLHEALTGKRLFRGENDLDTIRRITEGEVPVPSTLVPAVSKELDAVVLRALERDPAKRFQSAGEMMEALEKACSLAPARAVTAMLERTCGERLQERRDTLRQMVEGTLPPLALDLETERDNSEPSKSVPAAPDSAPPSEPSFGTGGQLSMLNAASEAPPRGGLRRALAAGVVVLVVVLVTAAGFFAMRRPAADAAGAARSATLAAPASAPSATSAPAASQMAADAVAADEVRITLHAHAPIESVRAPGTHRMAIDGDHATVVVQKWSGSLVVDATLRGGAHAKATLDAAGPREADLAVVEEAPRAPTAKTASPPKGRPRATSSELQASPY